MLQIYDIQIALQISIFAVTFSDILTREKMILEKLGVMLERLESNEKFGKLAYPLGYCGKCMAGFMALLSQFWLCLSPFALLSHITLSILCAAFLSAWYQRVTR